MNVQSQNEREPLLLDKLSLSGVGLKRIHPSWAPKDRVLHTKKVFSGEDLGVSVTSSNTAFMDWKDYTIDEFVYILNGTAEITLTDGSKLTFKKNDFFVVPKGFTGRWKTIGYSDDFIEIAAYARKRANKKTTASSPQGIDKNKLSGIGTQEGENLLFDGAELSIYINERAKSHSKSIKQSADYLVHILNGTATITFKDGATKTFHTGEFYTIPKGFKGNITYNAHNTYRELVVKSNVRLE